LAQNGVEGAVVEREGRCVALAPVDVGSYVTGNGQHGFVEIDADHVGRPDTVGCGAGDDPGTAGHVEDPPVSADTGGVAQDRRPLGEERRHERRLVGLGRFDRDLEGLGWLSTGHASMLRCRRPSSIGQLPHMPSGSGTLQGW
jgi:hypothetical protein